MVRRADPPVGQRATGCSHRIVDIGFGDACAIAERFAGGCLHHPFDVICGPEPATDEIPVRVLVWALPSALLWSEPSFSGEL